MTITWYGIDTLRLQAWTAGGSGSALHTYKPLQGTTGGIIQIGEPEIVQEEIELVDYSRDDKVRGYYLIINVTLEIAGGSFTGTTTDGPDTLETIMSHYWAGDWIKLSLDNGANYIRVRIDSDTGAQKLAGKNVGIHREISFKSCALRTGDIVPNGGGAL